MLLMITEREKWRHLAKKSLSRLLRKILLKCGGDYCCINCVHSLRKEGKLKSQEIVCINHDYCHIKISGEHNKIFKYDQDKKSLKNQFAIYSYTKPLLEKIRICDKNQERMSRIIMKKNIQHVAIQYWQSVYLIL